MSNVLLLDGGMGQELIKKAGKATGLWSVQALLDDPESVREVHDSFFAAGARAAITNTYSVLPDRLAPHDLQDRLIELSDLACQLAVDARDAHGSGLVLGGLGPIGFSYQPDKAPPAANAAEIYAPIAKAHAPFVDAHILETMSSIDQARGGLMGASATGKPVLLAVSVDDTDGTKLRSGEPVGDVHALAKEFSAAAVLVNCSVPEAINQAIPLLANQGIPVGAYANGFTKISDAFDHIGATVDLLSARKDLDPAKYSEFALQWIEQGATIVGGCCEVGPDHIRELAQQLTRAGHVLVEELP